MLGFILRRLAFAIPTLLGVSLLTFVMLKLVPGDPVLLLTGEDPSPEHYANVSRQLGLDRPVPIQYLSFLAGLPRGDLGVSYVTGEPIADQVARRYPRTITLAVSAMLFGLTFGILIGTLAGLKPGSPVDGFGIMVALAGISIPGFWLGLMLIFLFSVQLRWLPMLGLTTPAHLVLPTVTMGVGSVAFIARMTRANVIEVMSNEYVRTARAKGLRERAVVVGHVLKNALMPVITVAGVSFGFMLGGAAIAEVIFSIDGLGRMMVDAIFARDVALVQAGVMVLALNFVIITLVLDIVHGFMDPRIRYR